MHIFRFLHVFKHRHTPSRIIGLISQIRTQTKYIQSIVLLDGMAYFSQKSPFHRIAIGQQNIIYTNNPSPHIPNIKQSHATKRAHQDDSTQQKYKYICPNTAFSEKTMLQKEYISVLYVYVVYDWRLVGKNLSENKYTGEHIITKLYQNIQHNL